MERAEAASGLCAAGRAFAARGWVLATSGNMSAVLERDPLRLLVSASGKDKGELTPADLLEVDARGAVLAGAGRPSAETRLHLELVRLAGAGAVLHTHSVAGAVLCELEGAAAGGIELAGYEMLKALSGVETHLHREWVPVLQNQQDYEALAGTLAATLREHPACHAVLLDRHGLYAWGRDLAEARRHVEALEYLFEVRARLLGARGR